MKLRKICALFLASSLLLSVAACAPNTTVESKDDGGDDASTNTEAKVFSIGHSNPADPDDQYHYRDVCRTRFGVRLCGWRVERADQRPLDGLGRYFGHV